MYNFLFHRVHPERDQLWDPMDPELFEKCIKRIKSKYEVVLFEEYMNAGDFSNSNRVATIMFDDGYLDNFEFALPILEKYHIKASFYVVTNCIDKNEPTWTHVLEYIFQYSKNNHITFPFDFIPKEWKDNEFSSFDEKIAFIKKFKPFLKTISHQNREQVLNHLKQHWNDVELPKLMMNWEQVRTIYRKGHYIGSHTVNHVMLGTMEDETMIFDELKNSGTAIEKELGFFPRTISYPVGSYNQMVIEQSKKAGYMFGLAVGQDEQKLIDSNFFEIKRIELYNEPWWKTKLRISNSLEKIKKIIRYR